MERQYLGRSYICLRKMNWDLQLRRLTDPHLYSKSLVTHTWRRELHQRLLLPLIIRLGRVP
jgi:hypothetical protein